MKDRLKKLVNYFTITEIVLWLTSIAVILTTFFVFKNDNYVSLVASLIGVTSLIFCAKGNPFGQFLMVVFSILYAINSYSFRYYGEMITYLAMTMPMAILSIITWIKNPYKNDKKQVKINTIKAKEWIFASVLTIAVTIAFYFILRAFDTANLLISTVSVATSFISAYLTFRRSPFYALGYAANDVVLIIMWILATIENKSYLSVVICFCIFVINDSYSFYSWLKMKRAQSKNESADSVAR